MKNTLRLIAFMIGLTFTYTIQASDVRTIIVPQAIAVHAVVPDAIVIDNNISADTVEYKADLASSIINFDAANKENLRLCRIFSIKKKGFMLY